MKKRKKRAAPVVVGRREIAADEAPERTDWGVGVGDGVVRRPITFAGDGERPGRPTEGTVIFVHPKGRFHVVEFAFPGGGKLRESFRGA